MTMNVSRDVIKDLMPIYEDGEASADTRKLVEEFLAGDPELRADLTAAATVRYRRVMALAPPEPALQAMQAAKRELQRQKWTQFFAILLTLLPLSILVRHGQVEFLLFRDAPLVALGMWAGAVPLWLAYFRSRRPARAD